MPLNDRQPPTVSHVDMAAGAHWNSGCWQFPNLILSVIMSAHDTGWNWTFWNIYIQVGGVIRASLWASAGWHLQVQRAYMLKEDTRAPLGMRTGNCIWAQLVTHSLSSWLPGCSSIWDLAAILAEPCSTAIYRLIERRLHLNGNFPFDVFKYAVVNVSRDVFSTALSNLRKIWTVFIYNYFLWSALNNMVGPTCLTHKYKNTTSTQCASRES